VQLFGLLWVLNMYHILESKPATGAIYPVSTASVSECVAFIGAVVTSCTCTICADTANLAMLRVLWGLPIRTMLKG